MLSLAPTGCDSAPARPPGRYSGVPVTGENSPPGTLSEAALAASPVTGLNLEYFGTDKPGTFAR